MDPQTEFEMRRAQEMHQFVAEQLAVGEYPNENSRTLFASALDLAKSHHEAIMVLCQQEHLIGSAYALLRPLVEVANRGLFIAFLATPEQIETIKGGSEKPYGYFNDLVAKLDERFNTEGLFASFGGETWKELCGHAHRGGEQLIRRVGDDGVIGCHFDPEEVQLLLARSTLVLAQTATAFLGGMDR